MRLVEILTADRVLVASGLGSKRDALDAVSRLLAQGVADQGPTYERVRSVLEERELLQSTGIGDGVAIPHGFLGELTSQTAALLVVPEGVGFDSIDAKPARIIIGVVGPKRGMHVQVEHLRILARISKVLREPQLRDRIVASSSSADVFAKVVDADARTP